MQLLLDTHTLLWYVFNKPELSKSAAALIQDTSNETFLSIASVWELAIKHSLGKLPMVAPFGKFITEQLDKHFITVIPIHISHLEMLITLPHHHRDTFDRLIIAQSRTEDISIVSADKTFDAYGVKRLW